MKIPTLTLVAAATVAATITVPATAHADDNRQQFASPSGNIHCVLQVGAYTAAPVALCQITDTTYVVPAGVARDETSGEPCTGSGHRDFRLDPGQPGFIPCSYAALAGGFGPWPTLDYGQARSLGSLTCASEPTGVTCTDTSSGHFFRVSRESYDLG
jgi:hypothetical protein